MIGSTPKSEPANADSSKRNRSANRLMPTNSWRGWVSCLQAIRGPLNAEGERIEKDTISRRKFKAQRAPRSEDLGVPVVRNPDRRLANSAERQSGNAPGLPH